MTDIDRAGFLKLVSVNLPHLWVSCASMDDGNGAVVAMPPPPVPQNKRPPSQSPSSASLSICSTAFENVKAEAAGACLKLGLESDFMTFFTLLLSLMYSYSLYLQTFRWVIFVCSLKFESLKFEIVVFSSFNFNSVK